MTRRWNVAVATALALVGLPALPARAVIGGSEAAENPGVVSLEQVRSTGNRAEPQHVCSGALIAPRWVLTASHCLRAYVMGGARTGDRDRTRASVIGVAAQYQAPLGDLGLVKLASDAPGPYLSWSTEAVPTGTTVESLGFGAISVSGGQSATLKVARGRMSSLSTDPEYGGQMIAWKFLNGRTGIGDSGGPLVVDGVVVGAHSGIFDGDGGAAGLSTGAAWIRSMTGVAEGKRSDPYRAGALVPARPVAVPSGPVPVAPRLESQSFGFARAVAAPAVSV